MKRDRPKISLHLDGGESINVVGSADSDALAYVHLVLPFFMTNIEPANALEPDLLGVRVMKPDIPLELREGMICQM